MPDISDTSSRPDTVAIPLRERILAFTSGLTFYEFLDQANAAPGLLRQRYESIRLQAADQLFLATYPDWLYWIVVVTEDIPDTLMVLPILVRIADACPRINLRIVRDDDDLALLNALVEDTDMEEDLTDMDLPLLLVFDEEWSLQVQWGPRPKAAEDRLDEWLERHPEYETLLADESAEDPNDLARLIDKLTHEMRLWYNDDLTQACIAEIIAEMKDLQPEDEETET